jgi:hypothetical protein
MAKPVRHGGDTGAQPKCAAKLKSEKINTTNFRLKKWLSAMFLEQGPELIFKIRKSPLGGVVAKA